MSLPTGSARLVAGEVESIASEFEDEFGFRDLREQAGLVRKIDDIRRERPLVARRRHDQHPADLGRHRLDRRRV
jgi:hypothetical protein